MKKQMSYKAKRSMIILAVIAVLAIIASIGTYAFISGNDETQAMSQTNGTASDRAGQEVEQAQQGDNPSVQVQSEDNQNDNEQPSNDRNNEQIDVANTNNDNNNDNDNDNQTTTNATTTTDNGTQGTTNNQTTTTNNDGANTPTQTTQTVTTTDEVETTQILVGFRTASLNNQVPSVSAIIPTIETPDADTTAPVYNNMGIFNWTNDNDGDEDRTEDVKHATKGSHIRLFVSFPEMLAVNPKVDIYGNDGKVTTFDLQYSTGAKFYYVEFDITDEMNLPEGKINFRVYGYADAAGNVGADLTQDDTLSNEYPYVIYDVTAPGTGNQFEGFPLYVLSLTDDEYNHRQYINDGQTLRVEANFNEKLEELPVLTIGTGENIQTVTFRGGKETNGRYVYVADIKIDNSILKLNDGDRVEFKINNVSDLAGNTAEFSNEDATKYYVDGNLRYDQVTYDNTAPVTDYLGILNVTHLRLNNNGANEVLDRATNGDEVRVNIRFDEALTVEPTVKLGGNEYTAKYSEAMSGNSGKYYYSVDIKLEEEMDLTDGEEIPIEVYGYEDAAGNVGNTLNNEDINTKYEKVIYDITSPVRTSADFYVVGKHDETLIVEVSDNKKEQYQFAKNGDKIVMNAQFKEKLANIPTFVLIDSAGNRINLNEQGEVLDRGLDKNTHCYLYQASYIIAEDEANLVEGLMTIEISNIYDQVGLGEGYVITKPSNSRMIYYDRTNPELRVKNDEDLTIGYEPNYSKISFKLHDNIAIKELEINGEVIRTFSDRIITCSDANFDGFIKAYLSQGENTVVLRDWAGNEVEYTFNYDITAPERVYSTVRLDKEKEENPYIGEDKNKYYYVKNGEEFEFAMAFTEELKQAPTVTIAGRNVEMTLNEKVKEEESKYLYEGTFSIPEDETELEEGKLEIKVSNIVDFAGNVMEDTIQTPTSNRRIVVYDRQAPKTGVDGFPLFFLNYRLDDKRPYTVIKDGEKLFVEANFTEKLAHNPKISLIRKDETKTEAVEIPYVDMIGERYRYYAVLPFDAKDLQLENGDRINFEIADVEDKAGNTATFNNDNVTSMKLDDGREYGQVFYDNKAPEYYSLEILNITHYEENEKIKKENENIENEADKKELKDLKVATTGDRIRVLISFPADGEKLAVEPKLKINGIECGTIPYSEPTSTSVKRPYYLVDFTIADETNIERHRIKLDEGLVNIEVYGYEDAAGNTISEPLTNKDIRNTNYTEVVYDVTAPVHYSLGIFNNTHYNENYNITDESKKKDLNYATTGDQIRIRISFEEKLAVAPKLKIGDKEIPWGLPFSQPTTDTSGGNYYYLTDIDLTEEMLDGMNLKDGAPIPIEVYGYEDAAGNEGDIITNIGENSGIRNDGEFTEVVYDISAPEAKVSFNTESTNHSVIVTLTATEPITFIDSGTWNMDKADKYIYTKSYPENTTQTVKFIDRAGNEGSVVVEITNIDKTAPIPVIKYSTEKPTNKDVTATMTVDEEVEIIGSEEWKTEDNKTFTKTYTENTTDSFTIKDLAGNTTDVTVTINNIDKEGPVITVNTENKIYLKVGDEFEVPLATSIDEEEGTLHDGNLEFSKIDWYGNNGAKIFNFNKVDTNKEGQYNIFYNDKDSVGNSTQKIIKVYIRDYSKVTLGDPTYETLDNGNVLVTITANKLIKAPEGWTISDDGKSISKKYTDNTDYLGERVKITGVNGGSKNVTIKIDSVNENTVNIGTEESLIQLAKDINNGTSFAGKTIKLTKNINLSGEEWTPIYAGKLNGNGSMLNGATIDGQGYAIKGLTSSRDAYTPNGSIDTPYGNGFISENAGNLTIKNIKFYDTTIIDPTTEPANITSEYSQHYVGTVIGHNTGTVTIENITVKNSHLENSWQCGGIVGYSDTDITFKDCSISDSFIGGPNATAGTLFGLGIVNITVDNCKSYNVRLYTDSLTWDTTAKKEGNFWVGDLYQNHKDTKLTVNNSTETDVTVVKSIED